MEGLGKGTYSFVNLIPLLLTQLSHWPLLLPFLLPLLLLLLGLYLLLLSSLPFPLQPLALKSRGGRAALRKRQGLRRPAQAGIHELGLGC
jgi:hypothetical protein